jgi:hypothetical protein
MRSIEEYYTTKSKISHTTSKGDTVTVGDLVLNWADKVGVVTSIKKDFGRWRVYVHMLEQTGEGDYAPGYYACNYNQNNTIRAYNPNITINEG